jgi:TonB family protein
MSGIVTQSLFEPELKQPPSWRSYVTSGVVHSLIFVGLLVITFPAVQQIQKPEEHVVLIAPRLPEYSPKLVAPRRVETPKLVARQEIRPKPLPIIKPPVVRPVQVKQQLIAAAPEIKVAPPVTPYKPLPEQPKIDLPAPKPEIHTGIFEKADAAKGPPAPKPVKTGGFGDPNGVPASANSHPGLQVARVGSFDMPAGSGNSGGGGHAISGGVKTGGFGSSDSGGNGSGGTGRGGMVRTGGFGDSGVGRMQNVALRAKPAEPATTPVEILFKPKPAYTPEARSLKLQGQVALNVVFLADGSVHVLGVIHGLGHGLDEAAQTAAQQVRFRPATRGGVPVNTNATIYITFELT